MSARVSSSLGLSTVKRLSADRAADTIMAARREPTRGRGVSQGGVPAGWFGAQTRSEVVVGFFTSFSVDVQAVVFLQARSDVAVGFTVSNSAPPLLHVVTSAHVSSVVGPPRPLSHCVLVHVLRVLHLRSLFIASGVDSNWVSLHAVGLVQTRSDCEVGGDCGTPQHARVSH